MRSPQLVPLLYCVEIKLQTTRPTETPANLRHILNTCAQQGLAEAVKYGETIKALWGCMDEDELKSFRDEEFAISQVNNLNSQSTDDPIERSHVGRLRSARLRWSRQARSPVLHIFLEPFGSMRVDV